MDISTLYISVLSGAIGAFLTVLLFHISSLLLTKRNTKYEQARLAVVYMINLSNILAVRKAYNKLSHEFKNILSFFINFIDNNIKEDKLEFTSTHLLSSLLNDIFSNNIYDSKGQPDIKVLEALNMVKNIIKPTELDIKILSLLPNEAILNYFTITEQLKSFNYNIERIIRSIEKKQPEIIDVTLFLGMIYGAREIEKSANILWNALLKHTKIQAKWINYVLDQNTDKLVLLIEKAIQENKMINNAEKWYDQKVKEKNI